MTDTGRVNSVNSLMDVGSGAYRVTTMSSTYEIDLDRMVFRRVPRTVNPEGSLLRRDEELVMLLGIDDCTVGRPMGLRINLNVAGVDFTARQSTEVVSIARIHSPGLELRE